MKETLFSQCLRVCRCRMLIQTTVRPVEWNGKRATFAACEALGMEFNRKTNRQQANSIFIGFACCVCRLLHWFQVFIP